MYCGEMGRSPFELFADWLSGSQLRGFAQWAEQEVFFTDSGRAAIRLAAEIWNIGNNDDVIAPAYNCGSEISPFLAVGAHIKMYRVDSNGKIDVDDLVSRITPRTRVVIVTHYFGRPSEIGALLDICRERQIMVLEDCALSLFSKGIGHLCDAAIFSPRKSLPACDGGILVLRHAPAGEYSLKRAAPVATARSALSLMKKWSQQWLPAVRRSSQHDDTNCVSTNSALPDMPQSYYWNNGSFVRRGSRFGRGVLSRIDAIEVVRKRRENYAHLSRRLSDVPGIGFLWGGESLAEGVCPLGLPILVDDRRHWWGRLNAAGVSVSCWWEGYHRGIDWSEFPEARMLKDRLILLPVHQGLNTHHMQSVAEAVRTVSAGPNSKRHI